MGASSDLMTAEKLGASFSQHHKGGGDICFNILGDIFAASQVTGLIIIDVL